MSRQSKSKRDAQKKQQGARPIRRLGRPLVPHAHLKDEAGQVVGGGGQREDEWLMLLAGKVVASTESAAMLLAMLRHTQKVSKRPLKLEASTTLLRQASAEAEVHGQTLDEHLAWLEQERATRDDAPAEPTH